MYVFSGFFECVDVLPFLFYSFYLWDSCIIFLLLIFFCEINFLEFLKEALIWFDWFSNLTELTLLSFAVATCFLTYLALFSPQLLPEHPFSFFSVIYVMLNLGSTSRSYSLGVLPWKLALVGQFQAFLEIECPLSFRLPCYKLLHLPTFGACPTPPPSVSSGWDYLVGFSLLMPCPWLHCLLLLPLQRQPLHPYTNTPVRVHLLMYFLFCVAPCLHYILSLS